MPPEHLVWGRHRGQTLTFDKTTVVKNQSLTPMQTGRLLVSSGGRLTACGDASASALLLVFPSMASARRDGRRDRR